jgi:hypothetical protein
MAFSQMDVVASLGALLRGRRFFWLCVVCGCASEAVGSGGRASTSSLRRFLILASVLASPNFQEVFAASIFSFLTISIFRFLFFPKNFFGATGSAARYGEHCLHIATLDAGNRLVYMICPRSIEGQRH